MLRSNAPLIQKTAKRNIVRHPAKLSNILDPSHENIEIICIGVQKGVKTSFYGKTNIDHKKHSY